MPGDEPVNWSDPIQSTRAVLEYLDIKKRELLAGDNCLRDGTRATHVMRSSRCIFRHVSRNCFVHFLRRVMPSY
ncbi:hypothetical protein BVY11_12055 [Pseudomonas amygdali pv. morsprunorum]|nr:hypothetical protein BVY11_12055 [Pseudomonas amygdali pv. morsprunorum]PPS46646.1 hypothetical protein BVY12_00735 [Pseudomonas amygdali pv. morsprunorum]